MASLPLLPPPSPATVRFPACVSSPMTKVSSSTCGPSSSNNIKKREYFSNSNAILPLSLKNSSSWDELYEIQAHSIKANAIEDEVIFSKFFALCNSSRSLDLDFAKKNFFSLPHRNSLFWITLINGYAQSPLPETSILLFVKLLEEDSFLLCPHIVPPLLKACVKLSAFFEGAQIHSLATKCGMVVDSYVQNSLIQVYFGCGWPFVAQLLFDKMPARSVVTWNCVIAGYSELGLWEKVISLFWMMIEEALVEPNLVTFVRVVTACSKSDDFDSGKKIYRYIVENGVSLSLNLGNALMNMFMKFGDIKLARELFDELPMPDVVSWTTLITGYSRVGRIREAHEVFDRMPDRSIVTWNAIIAGYILNGLFKNAVLLYKEMLVLDLKPDKSTFLSVLSACAKSEDLPAGKVIHAYISKVGIDIALDLIHSILGLYTKCGEMNMAELLFRKMKVLNEISWTLMMTGYVRCGQIEVAMKIFNKMPKKDIASWNALITILAQNNHSFEALNIFEDMMRMKVTPNSLTLVSSLSCCAKIGALDLGKWIHFYIKRNDFKIDAQLSASLIDMYAKCGCIELSLEVFYRTPRKDLIVWSTIIRGLAMHGQSKLAFIIFKQMEDSGLQPDAITFLGVLSACNHSGFLEEGYHYFDKMSKVYGISPTVEHCSCMVDLLGRLGLLQQAKDFINRMGITSRSEAIWGALLAACKLHGDIMLAEYAVNMLLELNPTNSGAYVLLSNIYAKNSKWNCMRTVRILMKGKGIKKIPGFSSIEVNGGVHEFFVGDYSHSQSADIYMVLDGLEKLSKKCEYFID
ncbi:hypothetical protein IEQ34_019382 [Dendrobium chrysotoxum]|uniref:Chlororespiratory reduction 21 n=1 Tax=Dendrobium chrysotoxum TaxID=161865 RepID=A0AAV7G8H6_DENCH|nr:hypothetical protein IEQ34_019382 [Dendrobium chrysotoxum]